MSHCFTWSPMMSDREDHATEVAIAPETDMDRWRSCVLREEAEGKCRVMRDPKIKKRPPKKPTALW
jgi:hypothetical protein